MKGEKEYYGLLGGFDEYMNMVLRDCREYTGKSGKQVLVSRHEELLLNGAHICMLVPGENKALAEIE